MTVLPNTVPGTTLRIPYPNGEFQMVTDDVKKRADMARLITDLRAAKVELLSAQCAADRLRLNYALPDIAACGERQTLERAIASARALHQFFSQIEAEFLAQNEQRD